MKLVSIVLVAAVGIASGCSTAESLRIESETERSRKLVSQEDEAGFLHYDALSERAKQLIEPFPDCGSDIFERSSNFLGPPKSSESREQYYNTKIKLRSKKLKSHVGSFYDHIEKKFYIVQKPDSQELESLAKWLESEVSVFEYRIVPQCRPQEVLESTKAEINEIFDQYFPDQEPPESTVSLPTGIVSVYLREPNWRLQNTLVNRFGGKVFVRYRPEIEMEFD